jgi:hypothetical protein
MLDRPILAGCVHALEDKQQRALVLRVQQLEPLLEVGDTAPEPLLGGVFVFEVGRVAGTMTGKNGAVAWSDAITVDVHRGLVSLSRRGNAELAERAELINGFCELRPLLSFDSP